MKDKIKVSVIIPVRTITPYVRETVARLQVQTEKGFEIIIVTDKKEKLRGVKIIPSGEPTPAFKRNLGVKHARGEILAFLDDDSYPDKNWLKNSKNIFRGRKDCLAAVCGPALTPPDDNIFQKASGWVWASYIGSAGAGVYRNRIMPRREVEDFPSVNLLVRKDCFEKVNGFDVRHWPGEDTKLCLDLVKNGGKIIYDPEVLVYHHRRPVIIPHLVQISRYAQRRGFFARTFPETSFRFGYLLPSMFAYGLVSGSILSFFFHNFGWLFLSLVLFYFLMLLIAGLEVLKKEKDIYLAILVMISIYLTHLTYGLLFPLGYFREKIKTLPHEVDLAKRCYISG